MRPRVIFCLALASTTFLPDITAAAQRPDAEASQRPVRQYGDWFVACDNGLRCAAGSLSSDDDNDVAVMTVAQAPGPWGRTEIAILLPGKTPERLSYSIDGKPLPMHPQREGDWLRLSIMETRAAVGMVANGQTLAIADAKGVKVATVSLAGASAALRAIDSTQHREGTDVALVARGAAQGATVPLPRPLPRVAAVRAAGAWSMPFSASRIAAMRRDEECDGPSAAATAYPLDRQHALILIACDAAAYNFTSLPIVIDRAGHVSYAEVDSTDSDGDGRLDNPSLAAGILSTSVKGRGVGDCGHARQYVWNGRRFVTVGVQRQDVCGGNPAWPVLYRATPVWRAG